MNLWHDISAGKNPPEEINVIIEIPKGSQNKYEIDKETGLIKLDRVLYSAVHYPGDYGFIPKTLAEDGDPADAILLTTAPFPPGLLVEARPIGVLLMVDQGEKDEKLICVPKKDQRFAQMTDLNHVPKATLDEISNFFETYKKLEKKEVRIDGYRDSKTAKEFIGQCLQRYTKKFNKR